MRGARQPRPTPNKAGGAEAQPRPTPLPQQRPGGRDVSVMPGWMGGGVGDGRAPPRLRGGTGRGSRRAKTAVLRLGSRRPGGLACRARQAGGVPVPAARSAGPRARRRSCCRGVLAGGLAGAGCVGCSGVWVR